MDKNKIEMLCDQIVQAVNAVQIVGEKNMIQLLGIGRAARNILIELGKADGEVENE